MMLLGQAVEVAAKGLLVAQDPEKWIDEARPERPFGWGRWGHDIARLLREAGVTLTPDEERVADLLRNFIQWGGRYPAPTNLHTAHPLEWTSEDISAAEALYERLEAVRRELG